LSGELPAAAKQIGEWVAEQPSDAEPDFHSPLFRVGKTPALWERALKSSLPGTLVVNPLWRTIPEAVAVAVHLLEPARAVDDLDAASFPQAAHILGSLRENLWVSTFAARPSRLWPVAPGSPEHPAVMHPLLVGCLLAGLHEESAAADRRPGALAWADMFSRLSDTCRDADAPAGRLDSLARRFYYDLACDRFDQVVAELVKQFSLEEHRDWVHVLDQVTAAPCRWAAIEPAEQIIGRLAPDDQAGRDPVQATVAGLVVRLWLYRDPHAVPNTQWDNQISENFLRLANNHTARADTTALKEAAARFGLA